MRTAKEWCETMGYLIDDNRIAVIEQIQKDARASAFNDAITAPISIASRHSNEQCYVNDICAEVGNEIIRLRDL